MRVSTSQVYALGVAGIARQQETLLRTQQLVAAGKRVLTPSDDPVASTQALAIDQAASRLDQYSANIGAAKNALGLDESVLSQVTDLLQSVRTTAVNAGDASLSDSDRASLAADVQGRLEQLVGLANSKDGNGNYMYAGFAVGTQPFVAGAGGTVVYQGDQGVRTLDVASGRAIALGENGAAVFERVRNGNGAFVASAAPANTGSGVIAPGQVVDPSALTGHTYQLQFNVVGGVTTYNVLDVTTGAVSPPNAFTSGGSITVAGEQTTISGAPANGDVFTLAPSTAQSVFTTLTKLVAALNAPASGAAGGARLGNDLNAALTDIDQDLNHVLAVRADVGARLRELDSLSAGNDDRRLQYDQTRSGLIDLDYNQALSDFAKQQIALEAAQKSFLKVSGLALFDYL